MKDSIIVQVVFAKGDQIAKCKFRTPVFGMLRLVQFIYDRPRAHYYLDLGYYIKTVNIL